MDVIVGDPPGADLRWVSQDRGRGLRGFRPAAYIQRCRQ